VRVLRADRSRALIDPDQVRRAIPDPDPPPPARQRRSHSYQAGGEDELALVDPPSYFRALAGVEVPTGGDMIPCPLPDHEDSHTSCQVFAEAERGWWCYGCARGGRMYDVASLLAGGPWGRELRHDAFARAREFAAAGLGYVGASSCNPLRCHLQAASRERRLRPEHDS